MSTGLPAWVLKPAPRKPKWPNDHNKSWRARLRKVYGITPEQYDEMRAAQDQRCLICGRHEDDLPALSYGRMKDGTPPPPRPPSRRLVVDHCHTQGGVRGLLCLNCNTGLGAFGDDPEVLTRAIQYLAGGLGPVLSPPPAKAPLPAVVVDPAHRSAIDLLENRRSEAVSSSG